METEARHALPRIRRRVVHLQLMRAERALRRNRPRAALSLVGKALAAFDELRSDPEELPQAFDSLYGRALLLRARALAQKRNINAVAAYLRAREWADLERSDIAFLGDRLIASLPRTSRAFPVYVDWYRQADDPDAAEAKLRHITTIAPDEDTADSLFPIKRSLNEYLLAHFPQWHWLLDHLAAAHERVGDLRGAHRYLAEWRARDPDNRSVVCRERLIAGRMYMDERRPLESLAAFEAAMLSRGDRASEAAAELLTRTRTARLGAIQVRRLRRAFERYGEESQDAAFWVEYARWLESTDASTCVDALRRALEIDADHPDALRALANRLMSRDERREALDLLGRYVEARPTDVSARIEAAEIADACHEYERVVEMLDGLSTREPSLKILYAKALMALGDTERAESVLATLDADSLDRDDRRALDSLRADAALETGRFAEAAAQYRTLLDVYADDVSLWVRLGRARLGEGKCEDAAEAFTRALTDKPLHVKALAGRGSAYYRLGDLTRAMEDFRAAIEVAPDDARLQYGLALCLMDTSPDDAKVLLTSAVQRQPAFYGAWLALARLAESAGDWSAASHAYGEALSASDDGEAIAQRLAYAAMRAGDYGKALSVLEQRLSRVGPNHRLCYLLGYCCVRAGKLKAAARHWRIALLQRDDARLRRDLAWLHLRLADAARESKSRVEMTQQWNSAVEYSDSDEMLDALSRRWVHEAVYRLAASETAQPGSRDVQVAHDLMTEVLHHDAKDARHLMLAALCAARLGDWQLAEEIVTPLCGDGEWRTAAAYLLAICHREQNLPDRAISTLKMHGDWDQWETDTQALRTQIYLDAEDVDRAARELAMLRAMSPEACPDETAIAVLLKLRCWRHVYELVQETAPIERADFLHYAFGVAAVMCRREAEGLASLERVAEGSEWFEPAQRLRRAGYKRRALRAFQTLGWEDVVASLEEVARMDEEDETVRVWLERARDFAYLSRWDTLDSPALVKRWRDRLELDPRNVRALHQWATFAYWEAQADPTPEKWRHAMSLWGTLLNQRSYWRSWAVARLRRHDPAQWTESGRTAERERHLDQTVQELRQRMMGALMTDMTEAVMRGGGSSDELDVLLLDFLREYQTAELWQEWIERNGHLRDSVLPFGGYLLDVLGRLDEVRDILMTGAKLQATSLGERLLIYLSPLGSLLAAAETRNERLAREKARALFDSPDPEERRNARIIFIRAACLIDSIDEAPREGLELLLRARLCAAEEIVVGSALLEEIQWRPLFTELADRLVADVEQTDRGRPDDRIERAASARELLKRIYEITKIEGLLPPIVRLSLVQARALITAGRKATRSTGRVEFNEYDAAALDLLHETLSIAPDHVGVQQEAAQLRLRRGLVAADDGRLNEALIDFARAHELDPVSHRVATTYANFMMEQAARMWLDRRSESQREALSLAHRVLSTNPSDTQLLARCSRFLNLPEKHPLRETAEYRRLASLFLRYAHDRNGSEE